MCSICQSDIPRRSLNFPVSLSIQLYQSVTQSPLPNPFVSRHIRRLQLDPIPDSRCYFKDAPLWELKSWRAGFVSCAVDPTTPVTSLRRPISVQQDALDVALATFPASTSVLTCPAKKCRCSGRSFAQVTFEVGLSKVIKLIELKALVAPLQKLQRWVTLKGINIQALFLK